MKIDFQHLGGIEKGSIELNDFTVFCGKNNSGKTYAMYALYGLLNTKLNINFDFVKPIVEKLKQDGEYSFKVSDMIDNHQKEMVDYIEEHFNDYLPKLFGVSEDEFTNTSISLSFNNESLLDKAIQRPFGYYISISGSFLNFQKNAEDVFITFSNNKPVDFDVSDYLVNYIISRNLIVILFSSLAKNSFLLPAERAGLNLFFKELLSVRNLLLQNTQSDNINPMDFLKDIVDSRYAAPIKDYLQYLNEIGTKQKEISSFSEYAKLLKDNVIQGNYIVDDFGNVFFTHSNNSNKLQLHFCSSTVKTLFGLVFYLEHLAKTDDYLMIDEPELNLHPDNQRQVARVLAQLVNAGLKVVVSTHSDYFVRELNNLIMLKNGFEGSVELQNKYGYQDTELLDAGKVSAYLFDNQTITPMEINEEGIIAQTFDEVINNLNNSSNEIYFAMQEAKEING